MFITTKLYERLFILQDTFTLQHYHALLQGSDYITSNFDLRLRYIATTFIVCCMNILLKKCTYREMCTIFIIFKNNLE